MGDISSMIDVVSFENVVGMCEAQCWVVQQKEEVGFACEIGRGCFGWLHLSSLACMRR